MNRLIQALLWPFMRLYVHKSRRTRVLLICNNQVLLVRHRLDRPEWKVPGGGIKKGESAKDGVCRELKEELGLEVNVKDLIHLFDQAVTQQPFTYTAVCFAVELPSQEFRRHWLELARAEWFSIDALPVPMHPLVRPMLDSWQQLTKLKSS